MIYTSDNEWHRILLSAIAMRMQPRCFIELGLGPTPVIAQVAQHCAKAYGVDSEAHSGVYPNTTILRMTTDAFFDGYARTIDPPDLVFIDADHRSHQLLKDFHAVAKIATYNCLVVLHDTFPENELFLGDGYCSDAHTVPNQLWCEAVTLPFPPGVTICRLHPKSQV